jgi:hypothetical protein
MKGSFEFRVSSFGFLRVSSFKFQVPGWGTRSPDWTWMTLPKNIFQKLQFQLKLGHIRAGAAN